MQLLIFRHADAGDADEWAKTGSPDSERPLSSKGHKQMERGAKGLIQLVPRIDVMVSSPYTRALETTDHLLEQFAETTARKVTDTLVPDAEPDDFLRWLRTQDRHEVVAAVGHEPHLSTLATWLTAGIGESRLRLRKAGACLISFEKGPSRGDGTLEWLVGPKQLRIG